MARKPECNGGLFICVSVAANIATDFVTVLISCLVSFPVIAQPRVDIQPQRHARLASHQFAWGGAVAIGSVTGGANNRCRTAFEFKTINQGRPTAVSYINRYIVDGAVVGSREVPAGSRGGESFMEVLDLPSGAHRFELVLDANNTVAEADETNNRQHVNYTVSCSPSDVDVTAALQLRIAGREWRWNDTRRLQLRSSESTGKRDGDCRFPIEFTIIERNQRAVNTPFAVVIVENRRDGMPVQTIQSISAGGAAKISGQVWLHCCKRPEPRSAVLHIDPPPNPQLTDGDRANNRFELSYEISGTCR